MAQMTEWQASQACNPAAQHEAVIHDIFEPLTGSWQYIVADPSTSRAIVIDPVLDYDAATAKLTAHTADKLLRIISDNDYMVEMIVETHAHADHLTAAKYLQNKLALRQGQAPPIGIGERISQVQRLWAERFGMPDEQWLGAFDKLFSDNEAFRVGSLTCVAMHLPGHTPDHMGYLVGDNIFVGDSMFNADLGSARADFPGGDARVLFRSGKKLLELQDHVKIWSGHDYPPEEKKGRPAWMSVRDQRELNKHMRHSISEDDFVMMRTRRDATLSEPKLLNQALQINIRAGRLPSPSAPGICMLRLPLDLTGIEWSPEYS